MKKLLPLCCLIILLSACKPGDSQKKENPLAAPAFSDAETYTISATNLTPGCKEDSEIVCAINLSLKCTVNPSFSECVENKAYMPGFIFMQDDSLRRPTTVTYRINKLKPLEDGSVEVYTSSTCDGVWFGLCNGNIIYTMETLNGNWAVKDLYAVEN